MTVCQHFAQLGLIPNVKITINNCYLYEIHKPVLGKYGHLVPKNIGYKYPQYTLCTDLIGPCTVEDTTGIDYSLLAITMTDSLTGQVKVVEIKNKSTKHAEQILDYIQFSHYPCLVQCACEHRNKFLGKDFKEMLESYNIKPKSTMIKNPQANLVECVHQTLGSILHS